MKTSFTDTIALFKKSVLTKARVHITNYTNYNRFEIFNSSNKKHNAVELSLKNIYTSVNGFLPDLLTSLSIQANFRLTYQKHKMSQRTVQYMLKVIIRVATKPLLKQL